MTLSDNSDNNVLNLVGISATLHHNTVLTPSRMNLKPSFETTPLSLSKIEDNSIPSITWSTQLENEYFCQNYIAKFW